ncbi:hypothetical protein AVEN_202536-1 [Araneus ventricosus]|uniref:ATP-dependent DNA helicase n=1 Tax=Araneus ventricosus TaxID=182803 RepID=A0A4Y2IQ84_ARAVE|nr:hypothetical protein AVEN_202536-1 [Araneus ventricosus]
MLLFHVPGAKSFEELRTYESVTMDPFKDACSARNLLEDDGEWRNCLREYWMGLLGLLSNVKCKHVTSIGLPEPATSHSYVNIDFYDLETEIKEGERLMTMLNPEQHTISDAIMYEIRGVDEASSKTFPVKVFAGSGKCFSFNALIFSVRGLGEIAVPISWTDIAAIILEEGRTAHSRFKLPVHIFDNS